MKNLFAMISILLGILLFLLFLSFILKAWKVLEKNSVKRAAIIAAAVILPFIIFPFLPIAAELVFLAFIAVIILLILILIFLPIGRISVKKEVPTERFDERDIPFSRFRLEPGSSRYRDYYRGHPEAEEADSKMRLLPGLLSMEAKETTPLTTAAAKASFRFTEELKDRVNGGDTEEVEELIKAVSGLSGEDLTKWVKKLPLFYGARHSGITELKNYHLYSHIGRGAGQYGAPITLAHRYAIAFTVEMRNEMVQQGPGPGTIMESAREYANAAHIALQLTFFLRTLGYSARAHIDGNYRVICPLVARDAGLGEIGRLGFLITPDLGPRVRIAVVTTDMELIPDNYIPAASVIDFCNFCTKCADSCPAGAIPTDDRREYQGALRWRIDADVCFKYWNIIGTDCGRCMAVCPYSHGPLYSAIVVRKLVKHSGFARRALLWLDNLFYGRKPGSHRELYF